MQTILCRLWHFKIYTNPAGKGPREFKSRKSGQWPHSVNGFLELICTSAFTVYQTLESIFSFFFFWKVLGLWLCWVFAAVWALLQLWCGGFSLQGLLGLWSVDSRAGSSVAAERGLSGSVGSVVVAPRLSCSAARGLFRDQGSNLCLLRWQAESLPVSHKGSPENPFSFMF